MSKAYYMACLDLKGRRCLVVGGGAVGLEKAAGLATCGADVVVVSPTLADGFAELDVEWKQRRYRKRDLRGAFLVVAATEDTAVNTRVHRDAERRSMLCNVADVPELCNFILPAVHREGPIAIAVSTGGASPALAKRLRTQIAELVRPEHAELAEDLRAMRPEVKELFTTYEERRDYFEDIVTERLGTQRLETERLGPQRLEIERLEIERLETERLETERLETERLETERLEGARA